MHWRLKGLIQKALGVVPGGAHLHYWLQRTGGGLRDLGAECDSKVDDWQLMVGHLRSVGIPIAGTRFLEMGTGWYPTFPFCLYLAGAGGVDTLDLHRHLKPDLTRQCAQRLHAKVDAIAAAAGVEAAHVRERQQALLAALEHGVSLDAATGGVVRYRAPADAACTTLTAASIDVVFSNSVLEHVSGDVIERCFVEARRILRPGGVAFHSVNCGDHYAYVDRSIDQLHYLRYGHRAWRRWNNAFLYQNRLRAADFTAMARAAGFAIEVDTATARPHRLAALDAMTVHPDFAGYSREQLAITSIDFVARNP
jgi:SAM-dependent methyltransferase